jgi:hypothetical protein
MRRPSVSAVGVLATLTVAFVVAVVVVVVLTVRGGDDSPTSTGGDVGEADRPGPTSLADLAAAEVTVRRDAFCADVDDDAVVAALGAPDGSDGSGGSDVTAASWDNGDLLPTDAVPGTGASVQAVAHEYGCSWTSADGTVARAWVFAPPVAPARATRLARSAERADGCTPTTDDPFGDPSAAWTCTSGSTGDITAAGTTAGRGGLFGDAWLSCSVSEPTSQPAADPTELVARADSWCVASADAAAQVGG